jgi:hypothetical protein
MEPFTDDQLFELLHQARINNARDGITGLLIYHRDLFLQVIEGDDTAVSRLFARIRRDPRHADVTMVNINPISQRSFNEWTMGLFNGDERTSASITGFDDLFGRTFSIHLLCSIPSLAKRLLSAFHGGVWRQKVEETLRINFECPAQSG